MIVQAMLAMTGRVTMLGIARWSGAGGSYRTVQRFFHTVIPWAEMLWLFFQRYLLWAKDEYILAGDEVVVSKAGKETYGLDRFFSSLYQRAIPGLAFFALSLVSVQQRHSYPVMIEQVVRTAEEKAASRAKTEKRKCKGKSTAPGKRGRPKGSKSRNKQSVTLNPELQRIQAMLEKLLKRTQEWITLKYVALEGHFGHNAALQMVLRCGLHLISKLRSDAALYLPYDGPYCGHGQPKKYGDKINYSRLPEKHLKRSFVEDGIQTCIYQAVMLHKEFAQSLNGVIIAKTNLQTQARAHVVLFSSDLDLPFDKLIDAYSLRFQIEIVFTQMTKGRVLACGGRWDHVTDFHRFVVDDDSVNQQLYQLSALGEIELLECRLQAPTEIADAGGELGRVQLLLGLRLELTYLLRQAALGLGELLPLALELGATDDLGQVDLEQARLLALQLGQRSP